MGDGTDGTHGRSSGNIKVPGLVTDEFVPAEGERSTGPQSIPWQSVPQQSDDVISGGSDHVRCSEVQHSHNPFEVEPGHLDFLCWDDSLHSYPRQFSSKGDSSHSSRGNNPTHSGGSSNSVRKLSLSQFMADWVEDSSNGATPTYDVNPVAPEDYTSPGSRININSSPANPPRLAMHKGGTRPIRAALGSHLANYTWREVVSMTQNNKYKLGKGGFGSVYMGMLGGKKRVAVKILDVDSHQGNSEFQNEVHLLSRVDFVNLVKLVGFSQDGRQRALVYEYAEHGTLWDHLHGNPGLSDGTAVDWKMRLKIGLESACGIEYLHNVCNPRIIHRDIKSSNILLTEQWVAKVADFGLSKLGSDDNTQTHCSTMVKGTPGYLDPEYFRTGQLNQKSDVYSFGVVLLEMITGRGAIVENSSNGRKGVGDWVRAQWKSGRLKGVVDPRFHEAYNPKAMKIVLTLALQCVELEGRNRPDMRTVVAQLRLAAKLEQETVAKGPSKWNLKSIWM